MIHCFTSLVLVAKLSEMEGTEFVLDEKTSLEIISQFLVEEWDKLKPEDIEVTKLK